MMITSKGAVKLLKFKMTNPEELQSIISQKFTTINQVEPIRRAIATYESGNPMTGCAGAKAERV